MTTDEEHAELVTSLLVERYARNDWWTRKPSREVVADDDLTCARRRRVLVEAWVAGEDERATA